jgi:eukaryotic-like serine/threonine-protein kinase
MPISLAMTSSSASLRACFEAALELPRASRPAFLRRQCNDPAARSTLARMLAACDASDDGILDCPAEAVASTLATAVSSLDPAQWMGRSIGGAQLLAVLGQGGSAVVFRAEKRIQDAPQTVAVKLLRRVLLTEFEVRRFKGECRAMARLSHPHIARLLDGGISGGGLAYLVLEYIDGQRITDHAAQAGLDLRARLRLMIAVCRAVEAAHRALIVHRDLKPSNVLVTREGHVKLLDFGIAKFLDGDDETTAAGHAALTPAYAAPEQFSGATVTAATDVYALGVLLGELLTGQRLSAAAYRAPSTCVGADTDAALLRASPAQLRRQLRGDIDNIVAMALATDAQQRYASAGLLADDLQRCLDSRPVHAHPPSRSYRLKKFYRRHRAAVVIAAALCGLLALAVAAALRQTWLATAHAQQALATRDFLAEVFRMAEPAGARAAPATVAEVTEAALSRIDDDRRLDPRLRLDLKIQLGAVLRGQGRLPRAGDVLRAAAAQGEQAFGRDDALVTQAGLELGEVLIAAGDYAAAETLLGAIRPAAQDRDTQARHASIAAIVAARRGDPANAFRHIDAATAQCAAGCSVAVQLDLLGAQGDVYGTFDRNAASVEAFRNAAALAEKHYGPVHVRRAAALDGLGRAYRRMGRAEDARRVAQEVLDIDDRVGLPPLHWRRATHLHRLGNAYHDLGQYKQALALFEQSIAISTRVSDEKDQSLAIDIRNLGIVYYKLGEFDAAIRHLNDALARLVAANGIHHRNVADLRANLADVLASSGDTAAAMPMVQQAIADLRAAGEGSERQLAEAWMHQGSIFLLAGEPARALGSLDQAIALQAAPAQEIPEATRLHARVLRGVALAKTQGAAAKQELAAALHRLGELDTRHHVQAQGHFAYALLLLAEDDCAGAQASLVSGQQLMTRKPFSETHLRDAETGLAAALRQHCQLAGEPGM